MDTLRLEFTRNLIQGWMKNNIWILNIFVNITSDLIPDDLLHLIIKESLDRLRMFHRDGSSRSSITFNRWSRNFWTLVSFSNAIIVAFVQWKKSFQSWCPHLFVCCRIIEVFSKWFPRHLSVLQMSESFVSAQRIRVPSTTAASPAAKYRFDSRTDNDGITKAQISSMASGSKAILMVTFSRPHLTSSFTNTLLIIIDLWHWFTFFLFQINNCSAFTV